MKRNKYEKFDEDLNSSKKSLLGLSKEMIVLSAVLLVSCSVMLFLVAPLRKEVKIIEAVNETKERNIGLEKISLAKIVEINNENEEFQDNEIEKIKSFIPNRNNYEDYLAHFAKLANSKNIKISSFFVLENKSSKEQKNKALNETKISIKASGNFLNFLNFIQDIERGIPFICEESIVISKSEKSDEGEEDESEKVKTNVNPVLNYEVSLKFYHY